MNTQIASTAHKIYTDEEREKLWIIKLDKMKRYIMGEEVDIKWNYYDYWQLLEYYRNENKRMGYGSNEKNWDRIEYEKRIRIIKQETREKSLRR